MRAAHKWCEPNGTGGLSPPAGSRGGALEIFCKVALRRRNLRAPQSLFLALKNFARVVLKEGGGGGGD